MIFHDNKFDHRPQEKACGALFGVPITCLESFSQNVNLVAGEMMGATGTKNLLLLKLNSSISYLLAAKPTKPTAICSLPYHVTNRSKKPTNQPISQDLGFKVLRIQGWGYIGMGGLDTLEQHAYVSQQPSFFWYHHPLSTSSRTCQFLGVTPTFLRVWWLRKTLNPWCEPIDDVYVLTTSL